MLVRTRPARPTVAVRPFDRSFDRAFEQLTRSVFATAPRTPVVDAAWRDGDLVLTVDLPGVPAEHVDVNVADRVLTLAAHTDHLSWERSVTLGAALDPQSITANHVDGRLTVTVGAAPKPEARRIEIATTAPTAIETGESTSEAHEPSVASDAADATAASTPPAGDQPEAGTSET
jgi:HSP20 family protein